MDDFKKEVIRHGGDTDHDKKFCIFAVRVNADKTAGQRKRRYGEPYYLMRGFTVDGDKVKVEYGTDIALKDSIFNQFYADQGARAHINFSAIVGMNGSGKSTLVEYMLRLINNFSASFFGEYKLNAATDRLHYIDGMAMICVDGSKPDVAEDDRDVTLMASSVNFLKNALIGQGKEYMIPALEELLKMMPIYTKEEMRSYLIGLNAGWANLFGALDRFKVENRQLTPVGNYLSLVYARRITRLPSDFLRKMYDSMQFI